MSLIQRIFHLHDLQLVSKTYAPPVSDVTITGCSPRDTIGAVERAAHGCTTYVWKCSDTTCPKIVTTVALGREDAPS